MPFALGQFVAPSVPLLAWAGVGAMAVPIVIHLLSRLRRRPQPWGAMRFLVQAFRRQKTRLRIEQWLLLLIRCLILAILGLSLSGPGLRGCTAGNKWAESGRVVCLLLDDSLSTRAIDLDGKRRFDQLRDLALALVDSMGRADRVALWTIARPSQELVAPAVHDRARVRQRLKGLEPRYGRADLPAALASVVQTLAEDSVPSQRACVVILSDWAQDAVNLALDAPNSFVELAARSQLFVTRPVPPADNVQVEVATPQRAVVLADADSSAAIAIHVKLRRFVQEAAKATARLEFFVSGDSARPVSDIFHRQLTWLEGQTQTAFTAELPVPAIAEEGGPKERTLGVVTRLVEPTVGDVLTEDNTRWSMIVRREEIRVGIVDDHLREHADDPQVLTARDWLMAALAPDPVGADDLVAIIDLPVSLESREALDEIDAVMVPRPDLLSDGGWQALATAVREGALVWIWAPAEGGPAVWAEALRKHFGLQWQIELDPSRFADLGSRSLLAEDQAVPEPLAFLASDWPLLLRPVTVARRYPVSFPDDTAHASQVWLQTRDRQPLVLSKAIEEGRVVFCATALDVGWTNLPTKPLFVPLLHESLRSALQGSTSSRSDFVCGDQPLLGRSWRADDVLTNGSQQIRLQQFGEGIRPAAALADPGIYVSTEAPQRMLVVNVDAEAGRTLGIESSALERWLTKFAADWHWIDPSRPQNIFAVGQNILPLGWPLLWCVLLLVLAETALARWFSRASVVSRRRRPWRLARWRLR